MLRAGLRLLIDAQSDMRVVGEAGDGDRAAAVVRETSPDIVLMDLAMPTHSGIAAITELTRTARSTRVIVLTMYGEPAYVHGALAAGARGYVVKTCADVDLLAAIRTVACGGTFIDPSMGISLSDDDDAAPKSSSEARPNLRLLSSREREVLVLVAEGFTNEAIARRLAIGVRSVETYRARLMAKLALKSRAEMVRYALAAGLLVPKKG